MPEISRFYGIIITMYYNDHNPPHFHARYGNDVIMVEIENLKILEGSFPNRASIMVLEWAKYNQNKLLKNWENIRNEKPVFKIDPLD
ncbi:MAG: DUF4160 domain-containing protein [Ignavibacteriaceae bacterium]|jgi:hypothetical protein|nr:DUF4160 domain-containing protein [Ignavibacteriaceae bacterium]